MAEEKETKNEKDIALIKQDVSYIKKDVGEMKSDLRMMLEHYITRQEVEARFERTQNEIDGRFEGANVRISQKVDKEEYRKLEQKVNEHIDNGQLSWGAIWQSVITALITAVVLGTVVLLSQNGLL